MSAIYDALQLMTGQNGSLIINDTTARSGKWRRLSTLAASVVTLKSNGVTYSSVTLAAGVDIYANITELTLASGTVVVYT